MNTQTSAGVMRALQEMHLRRKQRAADFRVRAKHVFGKRPKRMEELRGTMFSRGETKEAFHELNSWDLALLENCIEGHISVGAFKVLENDALSPAYGVVRHNLLSGEEAVPASEFREASCCIARFLLDAVAAKFKIAPATTPILLAWRAGLAFGEPALQAGFRKFCHLGARRDEQTLETGIYYEELSPSLQNGASRGRTVLIADPMLATGNTIIASIRRLQSFGVKQENVIVVSVISAPEGVDHVLTTFPGVRIVTGNHDERLNNRGYIEPGLGDFGDLYFQGLGRKHILAWRERGILSENALRALDARMSALSAA